MEILRKRQGDQPCLRFQTSGLNCFFLNLFLNPKSPIKLVNFLCAPDYSYNYCVHVFDLIHIFFLFLIFPRGGGGYIGTSVYQILTVYHHYPIIFHYSWADYFLKNFFRPKPANPTKPEPNSNRVAGSGTGAGVVPAS